MTVDTITDEHEVPCHVCTAYVTTRRGPMSTRLYNPHYVRAGTATPVASDHEASRLCPRANVRALARQLRRARLPLDQRSS